jgi:glycosyltransferase involved in cell wall biosynthesis
MMRVLFVDHTAKIGGGELALANLVRELDRQIVDPVVVLFEEGPLLERLSPYTEVHVLPLPRDVADAKKDTLGWSSVLRLGPLFVTARQMIRVAKLARQLKVDIIHTNSLKADIIGGVAGRLVGVPVVWHVRDRIDVDYLMRPVVRVFRFLSRVIPTFVIANSRATLTTVQLNGQRPSAAIGSGVDLSKYTGSSFSDEQTADSFKVVKLEQRIGLVGRISPWKGQHIFLQAAADVLKGHPDAKFEIIGAALFDEQQYQAELHDLCRALAIEDSVSFVGFVEDIPTRITNLNILVHASTTGEPYGQVIIEGMAAEKPVVATDGGGVPEIVVNGITGILVPMGDAPKMADAIKYLLDNPDVGKRMGLAGRKRAVEHFTVERTARMVESVYQQICQTHKVNVISRA